MNPRAFVCSDCTKTAPQAGDCSCGAGPLLDLNDPLAIEMLVEQDDRAVERAKQRNLWIGVVTGLALVVGILATVPTVILAIPLPLPFANPIKVIGLMILIAAGTSKLVDVGMPARRKFPELKAAASAANPDLARMQRTSKSTWIAIGVCVGFLFLAGVITAVVKEYQRGKPKTAFLPGGQSPPDLELDPTAAAGPRFRDADFPILSPGILTLRGLVEIEEPKQALLYRAPAGHLVACTVDPDNQPHVACAQPDVSVRPQTARLVLGQKEIWIHGVTEMSETPEETKHGVFKLDGTAVEVDIETLKLAADRPKLPAPSPTWFRGTLESAPLELTRKSSGELMLTVASEEPKLVMLDHDRGGPATGQPITLKGKQGVVVLFQNKKGLCALRLDAAGELSAVGG